MVILDHGQDAFTVYGHLSGTALRPGLVVTRGQLVGTQRAPLRPGRPPPTSRCGSTVVRSIPYNGCVGPHDVTNPRRRPARLASGAGVRGRRRRPRAHRLGPGRELPLPAHLPGRGHAHPRQLRRAGRDRQGDARRDARAGRWPRPGQRLPRRRADEEPRPERRRHRASRARTDPPVLPAGDRRPRRLAGRQGRPAARRLRPLDRRTVDPRHHGVRRHAVAARQAGHQGEAGNLARQRRRAARDRAHPRSGGRGPGARAGRQPRHRRRAHRRVHADDGRRSEERGRRADPQRRVPRRDRPARHSHR